MTLHFLHVGKTGGTAIKGVLRHQLGVPDTPFGPLALPTADSMPLKKVPEEDYFMFCVRDPIARYASAFYSRLHKGQPRYFFDWSDDERAAFTRWPTPQALADALRSSDDEEREAAQFAMNHIRHVHRMSDRLGSRELLEQRRDHIVYIGRQETLAADWQHLREVLDLPRDSQLPNDPIRAHRGDPTTNRTFTPEQRAALEEWYAEDFAIVAFAEELRQEKGWGVTIPDAVPGLAEPGERKPILPPGPLSYEKLSVFLSNKLPPNSMWSELLNDVGATHVAELGVFKGEFAQRLINNVPSIETYYMLGPGDHGLGQFEPDKRLEVWHRAIDRTEFQASRRVLLEGPVEKSLEQIPDESLDFVHLGFNADHSLRGVTLDLHRVWPKLKVGAWIGGDEFSQKFYRRGLAAEPSLLFPYAVYFAELMGCRIFALPNRQFLLEKDPSQGYDFIRVFPGFKKIDLRHQLANYRGLVIEESDKQREQAKEQAAQQRAKQRELAEKRAAANRTPAQKAVKRAERKARRVVRRIRKAAAQRSK